VGPAAVVTVTGEVDEAAVVAACSVQPADDKVPRYVVIRREPLPRLPSGKIAKSIIRQDYADVAERYTRVR
jgi:fatty-acyl-CoA synthase